MSLISVTPLQASEFGEALVLVRLGYAGLDEAAWRGEAADLISDPGRGGVLLARDLPGRANGLMVFGILAVPDARPCLEVRRLVAFDLMEPGVIADALIKEAVRLARLQNCDSLRLVRPLDAPSDPVALVLASGIAALHSVF